MDELKKIKISTGGNHELGKKMVKKIKQTTGENPTTTIFLLDTICSFLEDVYQKTNSEKLKLFLENS